MSYTVRKYNRKLATESFSGIGGEVTVILNDNGYKGELPAVLYKIITSNNTRVNVKVDGYGNGKPAYLEKFLSWGEVRGSKTNTVSYWKSIANRDTDRNLIPFAIDSFGGYFALDITRDNTAKIVFVSSEDSDDTIYDISISEMEKALSIK